MSTITIIPLEKLRFGHELPNGGINSRISGRDAEIKELAASIALEGLLLPLIVIKGSDKKTDCYYAIDGNRRLAALRTLGWTDIECKVVDCVTEAEALSKSLAANGHVPLHPADRAETFAKLNKDKPAEQIAEQYGMTVRAVQQAIALGGTLAPEILNLWRTGEVKRQVVEVFTLTDNQDDQLAALEWLKTQWKWNDGREQTLTELRRKVMRNKEPEMKRLLGFVGIDAYRAAGGVVAEDFFGEGGNVKDMKLLHKLAKAKMDELIAAAQADGWSWAEARMKPNHMHHGYGEMKSKPEYTAEEKKRLREIEAATKTLDDDQNSVDIDVDEDDRIEAEREKLEQEASTIEEAAELRGYTPKQKAKGGIIISLNYDGTVRYTAGLIRRDETKAAKRGDSPHRPSQQQEQRAVTYAADRHVTGCVDEALEELLAGHPKEVFALFLAAGARSDYRDPFNLDSIGSIGVTGGDKKAKKLPFDKLYHDFLKLSPALMVNEAAKYLATGVKTDNDGSISGMILKIIGEDQLQKVLATKFDPKLYFDGASKRFLLAVMAETLGEDVRAAGEATGDKKVQEEVIAAVKKTGWLPPAMRTSKYVEPVPPKSKVATIDPKKAKTTTKKAAPKKKAA